MVNNFKKFQKERIKKKQGFKEYWKGWWWYYSRNYLRLFDSIITLVTFGFFSTRFYTKSLEGRYKEMGIKILAMQEKRK